MRLVACGASVWGWTRKRSHGMSEEKWRERMEDGRKQGDDGRLLAF